MRLTCWSAVIFPDIIRCINWITFFVEIGFTMRFLRRYVTALTLSWQEMSALSTWLYDPPTLYPPSALQAQRIGRVQRVIPGERIRLPRLRDQWINTQKLRCGRVVVAVDSVTPLERVEYGLALGGVASPYVYSYGAAVDFDRRGLRGSCVVCGCCVTGQPPSSLP